MDRTFSNHKIVGNLNPRLVIQENTRACFSACMMSIIPQENIDQRGITESKITDALIRTAIADNTGLDLKCAEELNSVMHGFGIHLSPVFGIWGLNDANITRIHNRLNAVEEALRAGENVILGFPKKREGEYGFLHYCVVSGIEDSQDGRAVTIMDPSDVDGRVDCITWKEFEKYITPIDDIPVMAWSTREYRPGSDDIDRSLPMSERDLSDELLDTPGIELLEDPLYLEEDTGKSIPPGTIDSVSRAMTTMEEIDQWTNIGDNVLSFEGKYGEGYPRFVIPGDVKCASMTIMGSVDWLPFPTFKSAHDAATQTRIFNPDISDAQIVERGGAFWLRDSFHNKYAWQHTGLGTSTRQARAIIGGRPINDFDARKIAETEVKTSIAFHTGARQEDIYLFPTGMAAMAFINKVMIGQMPEAASVQFGFPYTDTFEVQRKSGPFKDVKANVIDLRDEDVSRVRELVNSGTPLRSLCLEMPSNPLLSTPDINEVAKVLKGSVPVVLDDTIATMFNLDNRLLPEDVAIVWRSLTKYYSSVGNVMAGAVTLRTESTFYDSLKSAFDRDYEDALWFEDAQVLAHNGRSFAEVMPAINSNAQFLAEWLDSEYAGKNGVIDHVFYPSLGNHEAYDRYKTPHGGYGGLLTVEFADPSVAYRFYDALRITKGPSLGTFYSLACLYTKLAHKDVLSQVAKFGVSEHLVRLSAGIEDPSDLQGRCEDAINYGLSNKKIFV